MPSCVLDVHHQYDKLSQREAVRDCSIVGIYRLTVGAVNSCCTTIKLTVNIILVLILQ